MTLKLYRKILSFINPRICKTCGNQMRRVLPSDFKKEQIQSFRKEKVLSKVVERGWTCEKGCNGKDTIIII